jgi:imidazolonepropionase-like amidohydrolase
MCRSEPIVTIRALLASCVLVLLGACVRREVVSTGTAITGVSVIDVRTGSVVPGRTVVIQGGRITMVAPADELALGAGVIRIAGDGKYLIPGLWDMHVHLYRSLGGAEILPLFTVYGVTGVRDLGSQDSIYLWQREVAQGLRIGPRIVAAGAMLVSHTPPEGIQPGGSATSVQSETDARAAVRARRTEGAQLIKIQDSFLPRASWLSAAAEAAAQGLPIAAHVPMDLSLEDAIGAGLRNIEHAIGLAVAVVPGAAARRQRIMQRARPPGARHADIMAGYTALFEIEAEVWDLPADSALGAIADLMVRKGVVIDPTLTDLRSLATAASGRWSQDPRLAYLPATVRASWLAEIAGPLFSPENTRRSRVMLERLPRIIADLHRRGVTILAGTDVGAPFDFPGSDLHSELELLVAGGLTPLAALRAATLSPAEFMGMGDSAGTVEVGRLADLVLLDANPLAEVENSKRIAGVVQAGRYFNRAALDSMHAAVAQRFRRTDP